MTKFLLLHAEGSAPPADLGGELLDAGRLADPSLTVAVRGGCGSGLFRWYWLIDVESAERAAQIATAAGGPVSVCRLMTDHLDPDL
ncbi:hypothetical protein [Dactylosporangium matsuzakiense]|uniref:Uncharacterized protein n=1 Tax=Dactylosporangium matsuzakiense TaxID=53360 RepID=A0A9W6NRS4_9ACTN|nr:hypothetical protein [Dactylosporangium matsuzakiense]UWZ41671.1 hypothetical protein Dmats_28985 [Dactylosporangium matsuzakiense]GLL06718.1 hypothetical protein GCM10017581_084680 [Dactylosporangium matsuzakiense]